MTSPPKPSKKHHYVPQAQLRHFSRDGDRKSIFVFDKISGRSWTSSLLNAGSENDFNTVASEQGKWNFEHLFQDVDRRSAWLVSQLLEKRSVAWMTKEDHRALLDLIATQMLRTKLARTTPRHLASQFRDIIKSMGFDPDLDPSLAMPKEAELRLLAVKNFLEREGVMKPMSRLRPTLLAADEGGWFILSDHPVVMTNAFPYGDEALQAHGIIVLLPISPDLAISMVCPTIISRYENIDGIDMEPERRLRMQTYRAGWRSGLPIDISSDEIAGWNHKQIVRSSRYLYSDVNEFGFAKKLLNQKPELRNVGSHIKMGEMGRGLPTREGMPAGMQLVIDGKADHCIMPICEIDEEGEGLTARTTNLDLLEAVARDKHELRVHFYIDGAQRRMIGSATVERFGKPSIGWFRVVHMDPSLRSLDEKLNSGK
ncbi:MAG: DUF4238 domain-containing protein [Marinomonas sp.]